ncbi:MAG: DinB family protein [Pseudomonadota bacterium]
MTDPGASLSLKAYIVAQARNNRWSNHRLHAASAELSEAEYFAERPSFFGSIHAHLDHILVVDWLYLERMTGESFLPPHMGETLHAAFAPLAADQIRADETLIAFCEAATPETLATTVSFRLMSGQEMTERLVDVLAHLFTHQIHHRGQVHGLLSATPVAPPQLDEFFMAGDAPLRADEMRRIGLSP